MTDLGEYFNYVVPMTGEQMIKYQTNLTAVSLFAGVGGFDLAMERNGINVVASVEIDKHAAGILAKRFPKSTILNDVQKVSGNELRSAGFIPGRGILTGGFPCQDLSVAGKRAGLAGARSGLYWEIVRIIEETGPEWVVLENVPGLLSSNNGNDFGVVVGALVDRGYGVSWRVLDAQHFGVPQRRRRVFIVARRAGDTASCAKVLFERTSVQRDTSTGGTPGQEVTGDTGQGTEVAGSLTANGFRCDLNKAQSGHLTIGFSHTQGLDAQPSTNVFPTLRVGGGGHAVMEPVAFDEMNFTTTEKHQTLRAGTPQSTGVVEPIVHRMTAIGQYADDDDTGSSLTAVGYKEAKDLVIEPTLYEPHHGDGRATEGIANTLAARMGTGGNNTPVLVEPVVFVKAKRAQNDQDDETWKTDAPHPTLNQFDQGDSRTVTAVVEPIAIQGSVVGRNDQAGPGGKGHNEAGEPMFTLNTTDRHAVAYPIQDGREIEKSQNGIGIGDKDAPAYTVDTTGAQSVATVISPTLTAYNMDSRSPQSEESQRIVGSVFNTTGTVRRLTPTECERLQGFPDGWTEAQADSHRYKQMGNAVAVPVVEWIMQGIVEVMNNE